MAGWDKRIYRGIMQYRHFKITTFEREPGKWLASIKRADGSSITCQGTTLPFFTTAETTTAEYAVDLSKGAIDQGYLK
jgi:hypothetical protein